jgi:hypothetical protein
VRRTGPLLALGLLLLVLAPAQALAKAHTKPLPAAVSEVLTDCGHHSHLTRHYPASVLQQALADMPTYLKEYTPCANEILNAETKGVAPNRSLPTQTTKSAPAQLKRAEQLGGAPVDLAGEKIAAGAVSVHGSVLYDLPTPLLIVLILLAALASVPLGLRAHRIVRARRTR